MRITFFYDVVCPYAYLASTQIEAIADEAGATVAWKPVLLGGIYRAVQAPDNPSAARPQARIRIETRDLLRRGEWLGQEVRWPAGHPRRSVEAMRLVLASPDPVAMSKALFRAYWVDGRDIASRDVLADLAAAHDVDLSRIDDPGIKQELHNRTDEAVAAGAFGVPTFVVDDELIWGVDRLDRLRQRLGLRIPRREPIAEPGHVEVFFDFSSPFAYLGVSQIPALIERTGATATLTPFLLGALFHDLGTPNVPLLAMNPARRAWMAQDIDAWAEHRGVPFRFSPTFPLRTVTPLRVALLDSGTVPAIYSAAWAEGRDIGDEAVLTEVLDDAGFDGASLISATRDPTVKARLRANTERARAVGACGAPTWLVDDTYLFWGQDRIDQVEAALTGWRPEAG